MNCTTELTGNYCSHCGQKAISGKTTIRMIFSDFIQSVFLIEAPVYKTLTELLMKPGSMAQSYLAGKRKTYIPPFQFFLLFMTIYLLVLGFFGSQYMDLVNSTFQTDPGTISKIKTLNVQHIQNLIKQNLNILYFILTPIIALFIRIFNKKLEFNYAEILIFSFYLLGAGFFLSAVIGLLSILETRVFLLRFLIIFGYFPFAIAQFTKSKPIFGFLKAFFTVLISYMIYIFVISVLVLLYLFVDML